MNSQFIVIDKKGVVHVPQDFIEYENCPADFRILVEREALNRVESKEKIDVQKPEYLKYAHKMGFDWEPNAGIGFMSMDYKANLMHRLIKEYARQLVQNIGLPVFENSGSRMFLQSHPVVGAYADLYGERLFQPNIGKSKLVMAYDGSYPQFNLASKYQLSYKQLPFAHFSLAECYRLEKSGECMLFYRGRQFNMPDLHPYFKDIHEAWNWVPNIEQQVFQGARDANRHYVISVAVSSQKYWDEYKENIKQIAIRNDQDILVEIMPDAKKYWIVNVDYKIIDALGQSREISCIQIDVENAQRLDISYIDDQNNKHYPIIIHSAVSGGIERYLYMVFDQFQQSFPLWLHPVQLRLLPVSAKFVDICLQLVDKYLDKNVRIDIDDRDESISKKVKDSKNSFVPNVFVVGEKELHELEESGKIDQLEKLVKDIHIESENKPFINIDWPRCISKQVH